MLTLYLIRHGQKQKKDVDPELTELGHIQAKKTGEFLKGFPITRIIASPKTRTQQTASYIAASLGLDLQTDPRLRERMDYGEGKHPNRDVFFQEWSFSTWNRDFVPLSGDSSHTTGKRIEEVVCQIDPTVDAHVALVTHGGAITDFLRNIFPEEELEQLQYTFDEGKDFRIDECSITKVTKDGERYSLVDCHSTKHLEESVTS